MKNIFFKFTVLTICLFALAACSEQFLEKKPDKALLVPSSLNDYQALLDNINVFNNAPALGQIAGDDFYISDAGWQGLSVLEQNTYTWQKDVYSGTLMISDWNVPYQQVFYANVVLDGLESLDVNPGEQATYETLHASALFYRALALYGLTQTFTPGYDPASAGATQGIPVRLHADVEKPSLNLNLMQCYEQIISDLTVSAAKLPALSANRNRPCSASAYALMARVNLVMSSYDSALEAADKSLELSSSLLDYNTLDSLKAVPFPLALPSANPEVLFYDCLLNYNYLNNALTQVDTVLVKSYKPGDLRAKLFFQKGASGNLNFRGTYTGSIGVGTNSGLFCGLATDEVYLIKAECLARTGQKDKALQALNTVLEKRWQKQAFVPLTAADAGAALSVILQERRKELVGRGLRWSDLKRLNQQQGFRLDLKRKVAQKQYELPANDERYRFPVPVSEYVTARQGI